MAFSRKGVVKWNIPQSEPNSNSSKTQKLTANLDDSVSEKYVYSDKFEDQTFQQTYSDTFTSDSYSDTFMDGSSQTANGSDKNGSTDIKTVISLRTSVDASEIQEATNLETARTEMLETVIEVESDNSYTEGQSGTLKTTHDTDITKDHSREYLNTRTSDSHIYSDTFESSEKTKAESHYDDTRESQSGRSDYSDSFSTRTYTEYSDEDEGLLDRSYIAPDYDGKSLTDDEYEDTYDDDYSYTFEATETSTYIHHDPEKARIEAEEINIAEQAKKDFMKAVLAKLKSTPEKKWAKLETVPTSAEEVEEDDYLKHYCKKKIKLLKKKKHMNKGVNEGDEVSEMTDSSASLQGELLSDYGLPDTVLERVKMNNILSAMRRAAKEEIHDPAKCPDCRETKTKLDEEDAQRQFVQIHAKRLKSKLMDLKVEDHLLKMNSISMIAELARELPRATEKPEKIFDKLFEPLLGKNVMR